VRGSGIPFLTVRADVGHRDADESLAFDRLGLPDPLVEAHPAAVQMVPAVVGGQGVGGAIERELRLGDAVGVAAADRAEARVAGVVVGEGIKVQGDVVELALAVGDLDRRERGAKGHDHGVHTARIREGVTVHGGSFPRAAERLAGNGHRAGTPGSLLGGGLSFSLGLLG
jgi:hypothetical protein